MKKSKFIPLLLVAILICGILGGFVGTRLAPVVRNPVPTTTDGLGGYMFHFWGTVAEVTEEDHGERTISVIADYWTHYSPYNAMPSFCRGDIVVFRVLPLTMNWYYWDNEIPIPELKPGDVVHIEGSCRPYGSELVLGNVCFSFSNNIH